MALGVASTAGAAPGNGKLAYYKNGALYFSAQDGSAETKVSDAVEGGGGTTPLWSPDGAHVAYAAPVQEGAYIHAVPAVVGADGSGAKLLLPHGAFGIACWLGSSTVAAVGDPNWAGGTPVPDIYAVGLDGSTRRLTTDGRAKQVSPAGCAPDGTGVAYTEQRADYTSEARIAHVDGSQTVLTPPGMSSSPPAWSPDGSALAFNRGGGGSHGLYVSNPSGGNARLLTTRPATDIRWSPDSTEVLFTYAYTDYRQSCWKGMCPTSFEVWSAAADGSGERQLAGGGSDVTHGWSPDGTRIAFARGGRRFVMNRDGSCKTVLPNLDVDYDWQPVPGKPAEATMECADLSVSSDVQAVDLPLNATTQYTLTVTNLGNRPATGVVLDQPAVENSPLTSADPSQGACTVAESGIHCDLGSLPVGSSARVAVVVHLAGPTHVSLVPRVAAHEADGDPFDNSSQVSVAVLDCTILGTVGSDTLYGARHADRICGRFGDDRIYGGRGADVIEGGEGADIIVPGPGHDLVDGGGGEDVILARDNTRDVIDCGPQKDVAVVDRFDIVTHCKTVYRPAKRRHARAPR